MIPQILTLARAWLPASTDQSPRMDYSFCSGRGWGAELFYRKDLKERKEERGERALNLVPSFGVRVKSRDGLQGGGFRVSSFEFQVPEIGSGGPVLKFWHQGELCSR